MEKKEEAFDGDLFTEDEKRNIVERIWTVPNISDEDEEENTADLKYNELRKPEDRSEIRNHWDLIQEAHDLVLPRILKLQKKYPKGSYMSIGVSVVPINRDLIYDQKPEFIKRKSFNPPMKLEQQIIYRSNHSFNCLCIEYILQKHMQSGMWSYKFGRVMNKQRFSQPRKKDNKIEP